MLEISKIVIGDKISDGVYCLKSINEKMANYEVILKDKTGELICELAKERFSDNLKALENGAVKTTFIVKNGLNTQPLGVIKSIEKAEDGSFKATDLFDGLSEEKIFFYKNIIRECFSYIKRDDIKQLVAKILDESLLTKISRMPATLAYHGTYGGGALAATASITKMVMQTGFQYIKGQNGLYRALLDWDILIAASLLQYCGVPDYFTETRPFKKTPIGIERGYLSILQRKVELSNESLDDMTLAKLINILSCSAPFKSGVKATSSEGIILRHCSLMYEELDQIDAGMAEHEAEEGEEYFYDSRLRRNIKLPEREEKEAV